MLRLCLFIIVVGLTHELTLVSAQDETKDKVYYRRTDEGHLNGNKPSATKDANIAMEGQAPIAKKETTKIKPRKGVLMKEDEKDESLLHLVEKPVVEKTDEAATAAPAAATPQSKQPTDKSLQPTTEKSTTTVSTVPTVAKQLANATRETTKKFNPKPTVTFAEKDADDESMPPFPTSKSPLGTPRKMDYIVPVIITITALPLLGVAFYVLYKRGRDYWDKRHYRRMDFLIDGMYNE